MPTPMTTFTFQKLTALGYLLREVWLDQIKLNDPLFTLFNTQNSTDAIERTLGYGGFGRIAQTAEGAPVPYDNFELLYEADYQHKTYKEGFSVSRELFDDDRYGVFKDKATNLGIAFDREVIYQVASVFNNAFATNGPDAVPLCSASHPNSPTDAGVQSNTGTLALTYDNVVTTKQAMVRFKDSKGNPGLIMPDTLVVPPELLETAKIIVGEGQGFGGRPGTADKDVNPIAGMFTPVASPFLTNTKNWFMADSRYSRQWLRFWWRTQPELTQDDTKSNPAVGWFFQGFMRFSYGWDHWRWVYGHQPS